MMLAMDNGRSIIRPLSMGSPPGELVLRNVAMLLSRLQNILCESRWTASWALAILRAPPAGAGPDKHTREVARGRARRLSRRGPQLARGQLPARDAHRQPRR